jgi:hypothetical protein
VSWEPMSLATVAADELGADIATVRVTGLLEDDEDHLTGVDVLVAAGMAIAAAFFIGLVQGIIDETRQDVSRSSRSPDPTAWGHGTGAGLVRQLRHFVNRFTKRGKDTPSGDPIHDDTDPTTQFSVLVTTVRANLIENRIEVLQLEVAAENSKAEVVRTLTDLGLRAGRAEKLAPRLTEALLRELTEGMT